MQPSVDKKKLREAIAVIERFARVHWALLQVSVRCHVGSRLSLFFMTFIHQACLSCGGIAVFRVSQTQLIAI